MTLCLFFNEPHYTDLGHYYTDDMAHIKCELFILGPKRPLSTEIAIIST